jgi:heme-degrading monooxygenase HmoA
MIVRIVQLEIQPEFTQKFFSLYSSHKEMIKGNQGCISLQLLQSDENPNQLATLSHWESEEDLNHYRNSEFFRTLWSNVKPLFAEKAKAFSYHVWEEISNQSPENQ